MEEFISKRIVKDLVNTFDSESVLRILEEYPPANVAHVIRCRECARWEPDRSFQYTEDGALKIYGCCAITHHYFSEDHFCSDGIYLVNTQKSAAPEAPGAAGAESSD